MKKRFYSFDSFSLLFYLMIFLAIATYFIPSGAFSRVYDEAIGIRVIIPNSYKLVQDSPITFFQFLKAIPMGMMKASRIIIFVLLTGGFFEIIQSSNYVNKLMEYLKFKFYDKRELLIVLLVFVFALSGSIFGTAEEALPLYPLIVSFLQNIGFDKKSSFSVILLGTGLGFVAGFLNPFTTGIAQQIADLPPFSGIAFRLIIFLVFFVFTVYYILKNAELHTSQYLMEYKDVSFSTNKKDYLVIAISILSLLYLIYGSYTRSFKVEDISAIFLFLSITIGLISGMSPGRITSEFIKGASFMAKGALIIGMANAIIVIMEITNTLDTVIYGLFHLIKGNNRYLNATFMYISQSIINLLIPSGSGQAAATMPIMTNLADLTGVSRQTAVIAFQFGDGITNIISPTSGYLISGLALTGISWNDWFKKVFPVFIIWSVLGLAFVLIACHINIGPY